MLSNFVFFMDFCCFSRCRHNVYSVCSNVNVTDCSCRLFSEYGNRSLYRFCVSWSLSFESLESFCSFISSSSSSSSSSSLSVLLLLSWRFVSLTCLATTGLSWVGFVCDWFPCVCVTQGLSVKRENDDAVGNDEHMLIGSHGLGFGRKLWWWKSG